MGIQPIRSGFISGYIDDGAQIRDFRGFSVILRPWIRRNSRLRNSSLGGMALPQAHLRGLELAEWVLGVAGSQARVLAT